MKKHLAWVLMLGLLSLQYAPAQDAAKDASSAKISGIRGELLSQLAQGEQEVVDLAGAMPAETYSWRPMEGVRSVSEVYMHICGSNYLFPSFIGVKMPEGMSEDGQKAITEKSKVIDAVKVSFENIRQAIMNTPDADLDKTVKMFGKETSVRNVLLTGVLHVAEHLGQSIAYARMNHIVPPWTAAEQARQAEKEKK